MLSEKQFKLLRFLLIHKDENFTQRQLAEQLDLSLGTVNALVGKLKEEKWIDEEHHLNELGKNVLEPYRVENAIIMAAGIVVVLLLCLMKFPKDCFKSRGERLIEREIRQLQEAGIEDITVIVGIYKKKCSIWKKSLALKSL